MKTITLTDIPEPLAKRIEERAERDHLSLGHAIIAMLSDSPRPALAGSWTPEMLQEFEDAIADSRKIDPEMWR